jgi:hypothetical protein
MPGIEKLAKKKSIVEPEEAPKPVAPAWVKMIADTVFERIGGKPEGYVRHMVHPKWDNKFRMDVLLNLKKDPLPGRPDSGTTVEKYMSWWLVFSPTGELISSNPELPPIVV